MAYTYGRNLSTEERINKNIRDMVELQKGTVPFERTLGVDTKWQHKEDSRYTAKMITEMSDMLNEFETRANSKVRIDDEGSFVVEVELSDD